MSDLIFIGDTHGKTQELHVLLNGKIFPAYPDARVFQVGDMGLGFQGVYLLKQNPNFRFIRGNHDDPKQCQKHPNYLGEYGYLPDLKLFYCGGAFSIDKAWRVEGISWWEGEELSYPELEKAVELYKLHKPEVVVTHDCPPVASIELLKSLPGTYFKAKKECANSRTALAFQEMFAAHKPRWWVFGHYHYSKGFDIAGTNFVCVGELDVYRVERDNVGL